VSAPHKTRSPVSDWGFNFCVAVASSAETEAGEVMRLVRSNRRLSPDRNMTASNPITIERGVTNLRRPIRTEQSSQK
jgi:hypothetical protein